MVTLRIIQVNVNRSWQALDLLRQFAIEADIGLLLISEPPRGLKASNICLISADGLAAIIWRPEGTDGHICRPCTNGAGFVEARLGDISLISCYISPNVSLETFLSVLDDIHQIAIISGGLFIIGGDFNARSVFWGSSVTDKRGEYIENWASALNLNLLNTPGVFTCVRPQGSSVVDLSWA